MKPGAFEDTNIPDNPDIYFTYFSVLVLHVSGYIQIKLGVNCIFNVYSPTVTRWRPSRVTTSACRRSVVCAHASGGAPVAALIPCADSVSSSPRRKRYNTLILNESKL